MAGGKLLVRRCDLQKLKWVEMASKKASQSRIMGRDINLSEGKICSLKFLVGKNIKILHSFLERHQRCD